MATVLFDSPGVKAAAPLDVLLRWPAGKPVLMLSSGEGDGHAPWSRWSILAIPRAWYRFDGRSHLDWSCEPSWNPPQFTHHPVNDLEAVAGATRGSVAVDDEAWLPFRSGWMGTLGYGLGEWFEPAVKRGAKHCAAQPTRWPEIEMAWCDGAIVFDHAKGQWHLTGDFPAHLAWRLIDGHGEAGEATTAYAASPLMTDGSAEGFKRAVERAREYIHAGDAFQVNLAQRFFCDVSGSMRALAACALRMNEPWFGAYMEMTPDADGMARRLLSLSPELFLRVDLAGGDIVTRPIKGTRPRKVNPEVLQNSEKDAAELHMIVDLMRNDLGRVCRYGSVRVVHSRAIETHHSVHHGVAEVRGSLREGAGAGDVLRATFPPGSVTGAPKIRAMQIIDELEPAAHPRGPYCGAIGFISDHGLMEFSVAIRTAMIHGAPSAGARDGFQGRLHYFAGCGIVADSEPEAEWQECLAKSEAIRTVTQQSSA